MGRKLIAGNWKMNGLSHSLSEVKSLKEKLTGSENCDVLICPPATLLASLADAAKDSVVLLGGQDCHWETKGAHTGDVSAQMLKDAGASFVIVGHSERRADHDETSQMVARKAQAAQEHHLTPIICVGETLAEREAGKALDIVLMQISGSVPENFQAQDYVLAYEPVWAIGTGKVASPEDIKTMHRAIREKVGPDVRILYGGSMKPQNAAEILSVENVDGGLIGGASLLADDFYGIIKCA